jgi:hypothetical protein
MRILGVFVGGGKGATSWEFQVWAFSVRVCHLRGDYWRWKPWRRIRFQYWSKEHR